MHSRWCHVCCGISGHVNIVLKCCCHFVFFSGSALGKDSGKQAWETNEYHENEGVVVSLVRAAVKNQFILVSLRFTL